MLKNMKFKTSVFKTTIATKADKIGTTKQQVQIT